MHGQDLWKLLDAGGTQIDINQPANDGFFVRSFTSSEPWVTLQNDNLDYGVGLLHENALLDFQGWQNRSLPFNNFRSAFYFGIPAYGNVNARQVFVGWRVTQPFRLMPNGCRTIYPHLVFEF